MRRYFNFHSVLHGRIIKREEVGLNALISQALVWKTAREDKEGKLLDEHTQKVWEDCEVLSQSISQDDVGEYVDVLGRALGALEVSGRVRRVRFDISQGTYIGRRFKILLKMILMQGWQKWRRERKKISSSNGKEI
ncbi:uncharacterized protein LOC129313036 [Prosopis cineraria]|uniref:uncharacterized protein LOC129313036 n=1 Tax=Prosopis cineraria TaxID=364024 RepID=UPI00240EEB29|nr:uncharacterized protein LOC129313036 [Prosopis cineraria]